MGSRIVLDTLSYKYPGQTKYAISDISMEFIPGIIYGVIGSNGAGKTTLLKIVGLLLKPQEGKILINGEDPWTNNIEYYRQKTVYVHEKPIMLRTTVYNNLLYPLKLRGIPRGEAHKRIQSIAHTLGLSHLLKERAHKLSTGQKQLVGIARALLVDPEIIALDEPFSNLDFTKKKLVTSILQKLSSKGKTIIVSSHDTLTIEKTSGQLIVLENGKIICRGPTKKTIKFLYERNSSCSDN